MYINVSFVDMSNTIYVERSLWEKRSDLKLVLDYMAAPWSIDKILVNGSSISEKDLSRSLSSFNRTRTILGEYELQIEKYR